MDIHILSEGEHKNNNNTPPPFWLKAWILMSSVKAAISAAWVVSFIATLFSCEDSFLLHQRLAHALDGEPLYVVCCLCVDLRWDRS